MSQTIFRRYSKTDFIRTGISFTSFITEDDDYVPDYPYTNIPIPNELKSLDKVPFFDDGTQTWVDMSEDAEVMLAKKQASDLADAKNDAAAAKVTVADQLKTIQGLRTDLDTATAAIVQLAQATLPSTDAETEAK